MKCPIFVVLIFCFLAVDGAARDSARHGWIHQMRLEVGVSAVNLGNGTGLRIPIADGRNPIPIYLAIQLTFSNKDAIKLYYSGFNSFFLVHGDMRMLKTQRSFTELGMALQHSLDFKLNDILDLETALSADVLCRNHSGRIWDATPMSESVESYRFFELGTGISAHANFILKRKVFAGLTYGFAYAIPYNRAAGFYNLPESGSRFPDYIPSKWVSNARFRIGFMF